MIRKIIRIGNSVGITLDKRMLKKLGLDSTTYVKVEANPKAKKIIISKPKENDW